MPRKPRDDIEIDETEVEYSDNGYDEYDSHGPHRKKFLICTEDGVCVKIGDNLFPGQAAKKGASAGLEKLLVFDVQKSKYIPYRGMRLEIPEHELTPHQLQHGLRHKALVKRCQFDPENLPDLPAFPLFVEGVSPKRTPRPRGARGQSVAW